jgi:type IV secretory pathway VirB2 component (pilin)
MKSIGKTLEIMPLLAASALAALAIGFGATGARADAPQAQPVCGAHEAVITTLSGKFAEKPVSMGLANNGTVVEVLSSPDGSWTIVMTAPNGLTCLLAAGDYWQEVPEKLAGQTL